MNSCGPQLSLPLLWNHTCICYHNKFPKCGLWCPLYQHMRLQACSHAYIYRKLLPPCSVWGWFVSEVFPWAHCCKLMIFPERWADKQRFGGDFLFCFWAWKGGVRNYDFLCATSHLSPLYAEMHSAANLNIHTKFGILLVPPKTHTHTHTHTRTERHCVTEASHLSFSLSLNESMKKIPHPQ